MMQSQQVHVLSVIFLLLCLVHGSAALAQADDASQCGKEDDDKLRRERIIIAGETFELEVAADDAARAAGLMHRDSIDANGGMLFIYPRAAMRSFWMANCKVDIDILFLDAKGKIVALHRMKAEPLRGEYESETAYHARLKRYSSRRAAQFAIELKAGTIDRLELKVGQIIEMDYDRLKQLAEKSLPTADDGDDADADTDAGTDASEKPAAGRS